ncbi:MAG: hypothetical protein HKO79_08400 [Desulfobacterales bacterium]|nr:hypothetical protein [Deltaproteobacteria bacterium]NNL42504.1 hypothetical protein [Desulfobacterales bacterium]
MQNEMQITKIAYAKAWCMNGIIHYIIHGPLPWFIIVAATFTIISFFSENPPTLFRIIKSLIFALMAGFAVGVMTFPIIQRQAHKMEQNLTEEDLKSVRMKMEEIQPFKEITQFVVWASVICILFSVCLQFFK